MDLKSTAERGTDSHSARKERTISLKRLRRRAMSYDQSTATGQHRLGKQMHATKHHAAYQQSVQRTYFYTNDTVALVDVDCRYWQRCGCLSARTRVHSRSLNFLLLFLLVLLYLTW